MRSDNAAGAPERIWLKLDETEGLDRPPEEWAFPENGRLAHSYILETPTVLAASPEFATILAEALLAQREQIEADQAKLVREAEARGMERAISAAEDPPRKSAIPYRGDGVWNKNDRCEHDRWHYENCLSCSINAIRTEAAAILEEPK